MDMMRAMRHRSMPPRVPHYGARPNGLRRCPTLLLPSLLRKLSPVACCPAGDHEPSPPSTSTHQHAAPDTHAAQQQESGAPEHKHAKDSSSRKHSVHSSEKRRQHAQQQHATSHPLEALSHAAQDVATAASSAVRHELQALPEQLHHLPEQAARTAEHAAESLKHAAEATAHDLLVPLDELPPVAQRHNIREVLRETHRQVRLFVGWGAISMGVLWVWAAGMPLKRSQPYAFTITFPAAEGICAGVPLRLKGVNIGAVKSVTVDLHKVNAEVEVFLGQTRIPKHGSLFEYNRTGMVNPEPYIDITTAPLRPPAPTPADAAAGNGLAAGTAAGEGVAGGQEGLGTGGEVEVVGEVGEREEDRVRRHARLHRPLRDVRDTLREQQHDDMVEAGSDDERESEEGAAAAVEGGGAQARDIGVSDALKQPAEGVKGGPAGEDNTQQEEAARRQRQREERRRHMQDLVAAAQSAASQVDTRGLVAGDSCGASRVGRADTAADGGALVAKAQALDSLLQQLSEALPKEKPAEARTTIAVGAPNEVRAEALGRTQSGPVVTAEQLNNSPTPNQVDACRTQGLLICEGDTVTGYMGASSDELTRRLVLSNRGKGRIQGVPGIHHY